MSKKGWISIIIISILMLLMIVIQTFTTKNMGYLWFLLLPVLFGILPGVVLEILLRRRRGESEYRKYLTRKLEYIERPETKLSDMPEDRNIIALMLKNTDETTEYFSISKVQAKFSFAFSCIACSIGILILASSIVFVFVYKQLESAIIAVISGAITELIAGTVLWVHNKSALQLNLYYNALHENEKFLSTIDLANKLSDEKKEEIYCEIIRKQLNIDI